MNTKVLLVALLYTVLWGEVVLQCPQPNGRFVKEGSQCREYYECRNGVGIVMKCPIDELFDDQSKRCDWADLIECNGKGKVTDQCPEANGFFVKKGSHCKQYYQCINGVAIEMECLVGEIFDVGARTCDWAELVECTDKDPVCPSSNGKFPSKGSDCRTYVVCEGGRATIKLCPFNWLFNELNSDCDWPEVVECKNGGTTSSTRTTSVSTTPTLTSTETEATTTEITSTRATQSTTSTRATPSTTSTRATPSTTSTRATPSTTSTRATPSTTSTRATPSTTSSSTKTTTRTTPTITSESTTTSSTSIETQSPTAATTLSVTEETSTPTSIAPSTTTDACDTFGHPDCQPDKEVCPENHGLFPHPESKKLFIHCDHWRPYVKTCPPKLEFDPSKKVCVWPAPVKQS